MEGGCLAWSIVLSSFTIHFLESGFSDTFGLILPAIKRTFHASNAEASLANSLVIFLTLGISPLAAWLASRIGNRLTLALGVILASSGLFASGVYIDLTSSKYEVLTNASDNNNNIVGEDIKHPDILVLYATVGIFTGLGFGLTYLPAMTVIKMYFTERLGLACGIANAGTGLGQFVMAPIITYFLKNFSLDVVIYFFGACSWLPFHFVLSLNQRRIPQLQTEKKLITKIRIRVAGMKFCRFSRRHQNCC